MNNDLSEATQNTINMIERLMSPHVGEVEISPPFAYLDYKTDDMFLTFSIDQDGEFGYELEYNKANSDCIEAEVHNVNDILTWLKKNG